MWLRFLLNKSEPKTSETWGNNLVPPPCHRAEGHDINERGLTRKTGSSFLYGGCHKGPKICQELASISFKVRIRNQIGLKRNTVGFPTTVELLLHFSCQSKTDKKNWDVQNWKVFQYLGEIRIRITQESDNWICLKSFDGHSSHNYPWIIFPPFLLCLPIRHSPWPLCCIPPSSAFEILLPSSLGM